MHLLTKCNVCEPPVREWLDTKTSNCWVDKIRPSALPPSLHTQLQILFIHRTKSISNIFPISKDEYDSNAKNHEDVVHFWGINFAFLTIGCMYHLHSREIIQYYRLLDHWKCGWYERLACNNCSRCGYDKDRPIDCSWYELVESIIMIIGILDQVCCLPRIC